MAGVEGVKGPIGRFRREGAGRRLPRGVGLVERRRRPLPMAHQMHPRGDIRVKMSSMLALERVILRQMRVNCLAPPTTPCRSTFSAAPGLGREMHSSASVNALHLTAVPSAGRCLLGVDGGPVARRRRREARRRGPDDTSPTHRPPRPSGASDAQWCVREGAGHAPCSHPLARSSCAGPRLRADLDAPGSRDQRRVAAVTRPASGLGARCRRQAPDGRGGTRAIRLLLIVWTAECRDARAGVREPRAAVAPRVIASAGRRGRRRP
jgi:hypothetical protein